MQLRDPVGLFSVLTGDQIHLSGLCFQHTQHAFLPETLLQEMGMEGGHLDFHQVRPVVLSSLELRTPDPVVAIASAAVFLG